MGMITIYFDEPQCFNDIDGDVVITDEELAEIMKDVEHGNE